MLKFLKSFIVTIAFSCIAIGVFFGKIAVDIYLLCREQFSKGDARCFVPSEFITYEKYAVTVYVILALIFCIIGFFLFLGTKALVRYFHRRISKNS